MHVRRFDDIATFYDAVKGFLLQREAEHNLIFGLSQTLMKGPWPGWGKPYMAAVVDAREVIGVAFMTPPHDLIISHAADNRVLDQIAADVRTSFPALPGVNGKHEVVHAFADIWLRVSEQSRYQLKTPLRIYELRAVIPPREVPGELRAATRDDRDLLVDWLLAFHDDALAHPQNRKEIETRVDLNFEREGSNLYFWIDEEQPVSMVGYAGPTPNGIRVNAVYTPPDKRRKGYASIAVAQLSQMLLDSGHEFCFLYTDRNNPTSNNIYMEIGYRAVCDAAVYEFLYEDE